MRNLGYIVSGTPLPGLVKAVLDLAPPTDLHGVRQFLGLRAFNREYISYYMELTNQPLQDLTKKGVDIVADWKDDVHGRAFNALKHTLTHSPSLLTIDPNKPVTCEPYITQRFTVTWVLVPITCTMVLSLRYAFVHSSRVRVRVVVVVY